MERRRLAAVFVIISEACVLVDVIMLERDEFSIRRSAEPHTLLSARTMTDRLEHHLAAEDEFDRLAQLPRRRDRERTMRPWPELAAETGPDKFGDDADVLFWQAEHLREYAPKVEDRLRFLVDRQHLTIPDRSRPLQLDGIVRLSRCDISLVELDRCAGESALRISAFALHALRRLECGRNHFGLVVGLKIRIDVVFVLHIRRVDRIGRSFGAFKGVGDSERDVLAVVANDIVFEWRATLVDDAFHPLSQDGAENLSDVLAMKDRAHAGHFFGRACVQFGDFAAGDRCLDRNGVQRSRKVEVGGVLRRATYLQRAIDARRLATNRRRLWDFLCRWHV